MKTFVDQLRDDVSSEKLPTAMNDSGDGGHPLRNAELASSGKNR